MMCYPRFFIHLYFHQTTLDFKAVALPYNPIYIKRIKRIKGYRWNPNNEQEVISLPKS